MIGFRKIELKIRPFFNDMGAPAASVIELKRGDHLAALIITPFCFFGGFLITQVLNAG